jgi:hypothetical protein
MSDTKVDLEQHLRHSYPGKWSVPGVVTTEMLLTGLRTYWGDGEDVSLNRYSENDQRQMQKAIFEMIAMWEGWK